MSTPRKAVIVGAGIGGLASAIALEQAGWRVALLERAERLNAEGPAVTLLPNAQAALRALGLRVALDAIATPLTSGTLCRDDGRVLATLPITELPERLGPAVVVRRADLFEALVAALGDRVEIHTGITASRVDLVHTAAGDTSRRWSADLIVGADGIASSVRLGMDAGVKIAKTGAVAFRAVIPRHRAPELPQATGETQGPAGARFTYASMGKRGACWTAVTRGGLRPERVEVRHDLLSRWFGQWHDPIPRLIAATRPEEITQYEIAYLKPLPRGFTHIGDTGAAVLVGDAAHAMPPDLGQGPGLALEDGVTLGVCLTDASLAQGLARYQTLRHQRAVKLARVAQRLGSVLGARGRLTAPMRDGLMRATPDTWLGRQSLAGVDWRPPRVGD